MKFCIFCGKELAMEATFCPYCGKSLAPTPQPEKPKMDGGTRGKGIASLVLGIESLGVSTASLVFLLIQVIFTAVPENYMRAAAILLCIYVLVFAAISLGCGIAGRILGKKSLAKAPEYKLAKVGAPMSTAAIISGAATMALSLICAIFAAVSL